MRESPHISIKPEQIYDLFGFSITNSYFAALIVIILFFFLAIYYSFQVKKTNKTNFFYFIHFTFRAIYNFFQNVVADRIGSLFPLLGALFFYILLLNWFGLLPGVGSILIREGYHFVPLLRGNTTDLNTTLALALTAFVSIQYYGMRELGITRYLTKFINFSNPISFFTGLLEVISEFSKVLSFSFRLFGNIFAGEVLLVIIAFLMPILASFPFLLLETFVGLVQAIVFSMLTAVFILNATAKSH